MVGKGVLWPRAKIDALAGNGAILLAAASGAGPRIGGAAASIMGVAAHIIEFINKNMSVHPIARRRHTAVVCGRPLAPLLAKRRADGRHPALSRVSRSHDI